MKSEKHPYRSGFCGAERHATCRGEYAGTECTCTCHAQVELEFVPAVLPSRLRLTDPAPVLAAVSLATDSLAAS